MYSETSRRSFLRLSTMAGIASALKVNTVLANDPANSSFDPFDKGKSLIILFQGDSITDGNRGRSTDPNHIMGHGYAFSIASRIGADFPESKHSFYNRGISGNRVSDLKDRWQADTLDLKPDVLSILIGINDVLTLINKKDVEDKEVDQFENTYRDILVQSKQYNPDILFVLCLPFIYPVGKVKDNWEKYSSTLAKLTGQIKKLAKEFNAAIVNFPAAIDKVIERAPLEYWIWDGIHPTVPAHEIMTREWIKQVSTRLKFLRMYNYK